MSSQIVKKLVLIKSVLPRLMYSVNLKSDYDVSKHLITSLDLKNERLKNGQNLKHSSKKQSKLLQLRWLILLALKIIRKIRKKIDVVFFVELLEELIITTFYEIACKN